MGRYELYILGSNESSTPPPPSRTSYFGSVCTMADFQYAAVVLRHAVGMYNVDAICQNPTPFESVESGQGEQVCRTVDGIRHHPYWPDFSWLLCPQREGVATPERVSLQ